MSAGRGVFSGRSKSPAITRTYQHSPETKKFIPNQKSFPLLTGKAFLPGEASCRGVSRLGLGDTAPFSDSTLPVVLAYNGKL